MPNLLLMGVTAQSFNLLINPNRPVDLGTLLSESPVPSSSSLSVVGPFDRSSPSDGGGVSQSKIAAVRNGLRWRREHFPDMSDRTRTQQTNAKTSYRRSLKTRPCRLNEGVDANDVGQDVGNVFDEG